jgi:flagellar hook-associated protein 1 FlgK
MSFGSITNIARTALRVSQLGVQVTGSNIANAQTEGYSRQRVDQFATYPDITPFGRLGTGVDAHVARVRDRLADSVYRREAGRSADYGARSEVLGQLEGVFGEPSDTGLAAGLDAFWNAWSDLSNLPDSAAAKAMVRQQGSALASSLNRAATQIDDVVDLVKTRLTASVSEINSLSGRVAELNVAIVRTEAGGLQQAADLRDQRDLLLDRLSGLGSTRVYEEDNGAVKVVLDGATLVDGPTRTELDTPTFTVSGSQLSVTVTAGGERLQSPKEGSTIGQLARLVNEEIYGSEGVRTRLDDLASGIVSRMNELHEAGWSEAGEALGMGGGGTPYTGSGVPFFDPAGVTAGSIRLSDAVSADYDVIAAGYTLDGPKDNRLALDIAALRDDATTMGGGTRSFAGDYQEIVSRLAVKVDSAENSRDAFDALATQAENQRTSVSGVSVDEELIRLVQFQQSYTAASKLLSVADEMLESLLNIR